MTRAMQTLAARVALALAAAGTVLAPSAHAQRTMTPSAMSPEAKRSEWLLVTTVEQGWDSNVRYLTGKDADFITQGNASLKVLRIRPRSKVGITASGGLVNYRTVTDFNAFTYAVGLDGNRRLTPKVTGFAGAGYQKRLSTDVVGAAGLPLLSLSNQETFNAATGLERRFSPATTATADVTYSSTTFDSPALVPGSAWVGKGQVKHLYGRRSSVSVLGEVQQGQSQGVPLDAQTLSLGWEPPLGRLQGKFVLGSTRISTGATPQYIATGAAQLSDSLGGGAFTAGVARSVSQAFGVGQLLTNEGASLSYDFKARRGNFVTLGAATSRSIPSSGTGIRFTSQALTAGLRRVLRSGLTLGASASYRQRKDIVEAKGYGFNMAFGYAFGSR